MRAKHGDDETQHLPKQSGKPASSGLYTWLCNNIMQRFDDGAKLVAQCHEHSVERYAWLLSQIEAKQTEDSARLLQEFHEKRLYTEAEQRQAHRNFELQQFQQRLAERPDDAWLPKKIARIEREIEKAEARWRFENKG